MSGLMDDEKTEEQAAAEAGKREGYALEDESIAESADSDEEPGDAVPPANAFGRGGDLPEEEDEESEQDASAAEAEAEAADLREQRRQRRARNRVVEIGWLVDGGGPNFLWDSPRPVKGGDGRAPEHPKAVNHCPAVIDQDARTYSVACPVDLHLRLGTDDKGNPKLINAAGMKSTVSGSKLDRMITVMAQNRWRHPKRPVLQVVAPYRFICDEPCWMNQLPPYYDYKSPQWPGLMIGGRFPIHNWPRSLMWAFEWHDTARDLIVKRGEPWFYVRFEIMDPSRPQRIVEAEMTPELREFCSGLDGITNYVNQTFSVMDVAAERRPPKLLTRKLRGGHHAAAPAGPEVLTPHGEGN